MIWSIGGSPSGGWVLYDIPCIIKCCQKSLFYYFAFPLDGVVSEMDKKSCLDVKFWLDLILLLHLFIYFSIIMVHQMPW